MNDIGIDRQKLTAALIDSGLAETELCARAGVAHQTVRKMLKGQMVRFPSVSRICKTLGVNPAEILKEVEGDETIPAQG
jgi:DNA-binding Xre family transcriptional regulator